MGRKKYCKELKAQIRLDAIKGFETITELLSRLKEYFEFYNFERPHQPLGGESPAEIYWQTEVVKKAA
jgi:transposase InsO family protein